MKKCVQLNGATDVTLFNTSLFHNQFDHKILELENINKTFLDELIASEALESIKNLDPANFLTPENEDYLADLEKLSKATGAFINTHYPVYKKLVEQYEALFQDDLTKDEKQS